MTFKWNEQYICTGIPDVSLAKFEKKENGNQWFTVSIKSIPEPFLVQWSKKEKNGDTVQLINVNAEEYKGSSCSLTHPVLVVKQRELLEHFNFQIEVRSFVGTCTKTIQGKIKVFLYRSLKTKNQVSKVYRFNIIKLDMINNSDFH